VTRRVATIVAIVFLIAQAVALTWPVVTWFDDIDTRILGLPLPFAWVAGWVAATFFVMGWLMMIDRGGAAPELCDEDDE